jgi:hypothetical protein
MSTTTHTPQEIAAHIHRTGRDIFYKEGVCGSSIDHLFRMIEERIVAAIERERAVRDDLLAALEEAVKDCRCSLRERESGHLVDCFAPNARAAIRRAREGQ